MKHALVSLVAAALVLGTLGFTSSLQAKGASMVDTAARLYKSASPASFDNSCKGPKAKLEVEGDRHKCTTPQLTRIVEFSGDKATKATVSKKGIHQGVVGQATRKFGKADSVKKLGPLKMHFWFTDKVRVGVAFQSSKASSRTMVTFDSQS